MKFTINRNQFINQINNVQRAISAKTTIPILTGMKLVATDKGLLVTGSDVDISVQNLIEQQDADNDLTIESTGAIVLPARFFNDIIKKLPGEQFTLEIIENNQTLITSGNSEFTLNGLDANNYPHLPEVETNDQLTISAEILHQLVSETVFSASTQENRPILTGLHLKISGNELLAVATDSHRLAQRKVTITNQNQNEYDLVIPAKSLTELVRSFSDRDQDVKISISENQILFEFSNTLFYSRLLEGNYPATDRLIPNESTTQLEFDAKSLLASVERASLLAHASRNNVVRLVIEVATKKAIIYGNSPEVGTVEEVLQPTNISGEDLEISFNPDYLKDALRAFGDTKIQLEFTAALHPFTLKPISNAENFIQLITPVRTF
ncbi:MAG: DNA polymerase III subunit beta [Lactobacillus sp.]|uniref:Beta sliding clamp n=1 Tax=Bombilactobacillus bombi TaxID=1303590 RepID=A0A347STG9_9LACO|nr:DNA polymerase III subunit beta [Bombilactobacillus bombi]AXX65328.1 DNA polymerase III subunit beta [Bombilactobacillus bombi]MCO6543668.1 DNA polymerase III subunit beta [Lactobacillus sp.]RHW48519.1 DNA polymerase III subunit beta [Bombilactobacillus bombi]RHW52262.1 DNA polymerase III subunit beta [Bombilactobacillus bombi]